MSCRALHEAPVWTARRACWRHREAVEVVFVGIPEQDADRAHSAAPGTSFASITIAAAQPRWETYATLAGEPRLAAGRRVRVFSGAAADVTDPIVTGEVRRYLGHGPGDSAGVRFSPNGVDLRLVDQFGTVVHALRMAPPDAFAPEAVHIARAADGTGFVMVRPDPANPAGSSLVPGRYRLSITYRRDNTGKDPTSLKLSENGDTGNELVAIDIQL